MQAPSTPRPGARAMFALALWLTAAAVTALVVGGRVAPATTQRVGDTVGHLLGLAILIAGGAGLAALLIWPPAVPWLRLAWRRTRGRMSVDQGPMLEALSRLQHFESAHDHLAVGRVLLRLGQARRAIPHLIRSSELDPSSTQAAYLAGVALLEVGATEPAVKALQHAAQLDPHHGFGAVLADLGRALVRAGQDTEAEAALARHEERYGASPTVDLMRGRIAARAGDRDRARELFQRAAAPAPESAPQNPEDRLARARARVAARTLGGAR